MTETAGSTDRFASLRLPVYRRLLTGGTFNFLAMQISIIARGWLAFDLTGTNTALGGVLIGFGLSSIIAIPTGGVLADRLPKRKVLIATGAAQSLVSLLLAVAVATDVIAYWMLVVASILQGFIISLLGPARLAFMAEVVPRERLTNAIFLSQSALQFTRVFGPATAGALIGVQTVGISGVYFIAAGCAALGLFFTFGLPEGKPSAQSQRSPREDLADGLRFVRSNPRIARLLVMSYLVVLIGFPHVAFLPTMAEDIFDAGSSGFGLFTTAAAVGALVTSLSLANVKRQRLWTYQVTGALVFGLSLTAFGVAPEFWVAMLVMVVIGASSAAFQALNNSLILSNTPVEYHGRVQSLLMLSFSGYGLAALPIGIIADAAGLRETMVSLGVLVGVVALVFIALHLRQTQPVEATL